MIFRHLTHILCWTLIVNSTIKNVRAISFDDIFEYFLDGIDDSDESSEELANSNLNVTCKNCTLSVECHNCTQNHKDIQTTLPIHTTTTTTQNNQQHTTSSLPTPTIPAPEVVGVVSSNNVPSGNTVTTSQSDQTTTTTVASGASNATPETSLPQTDNTKSLGDETQVTDDGVNVTTDAVLNSSEGVTVGDDTT